MRVHMENIYTDVLQEKSSGFSVENALEQISEVDTGVFLLLRKQDSRDILESIDNPNFVQSDDLRTFVIGAQILADLGVTKMQILGSPRVLHGLEGFGLTITGYVDTKKYGNYGDI